ncbi:MAG: PAS domain-containing protein [Planctomycetaceae bacterium]|nr:PAS domain-containing protein [Planctomycetaceae bacterium]
MSNGSEINITYASEARTDELLQQHERRIWSDTDRMFILLMMLQWIGGVAAAMYVSPSTWIGRISTVHIHVWAALLIGGLISLPPILLAIWKPGERITRHVIAISQGCWSALLIHLTGGRIETHFHVFGSLAILAFYRDWTVLLSATIVVAGDHCLRGIFWPLSVYGVPVESPWRWVEHAAWVVFEDIFLFLSCARARRAAREICQTQAILEDVNRHVEDRVTLRTRELADAKQFFQSVLDSMDAHICILDDRGTIVDTNASWKRFAEHNDGTGIGVGANYIEVCRGASGDCEDGAHTVADGIESVIEDRTNFFNSEYECHSPDEPHWFQVSVTPLKSHSRGAAVVAHTEITERVIAQVRLREATLENEKLAMVARHTDNSVLILDTDGCVEWVNEAYSRMSGFEPDEVRGRSILAILASPDASPRELESIRRAVNEQSGFDGELDRVTKSGDSYAVAIELRIIRDEEGRLLRYVQIEKDITQQKLAEAERERLHDRLQSTARQAGMADVATGVLHNVGNVLNSVNVSGNLMMEGLNRSRVGRLGQIAGVLSDARDDLVYFLTEDTRGQHFPKLFDELSRHLMSEQDQMKQELGSLLTNIEHIKEIVSMQQTYATTRGCLEPVSPEALIEAALQLNDAGFARHNVSVIRETAKCPT